MSNATLFWIFAFIQAMWAAGLSHIDGDHLGRFFGIILADIFAVIAFYCNNKYKERNGLK